MIGDQELASVRQLYYSLFVKLLWREPENDFIASLADNIEERAEGAGKLSPKLGEGWKRIAKFLKASGPEQVTDEFTRLYLGPYQPEVVPYESHYIVGSLFKEPLIEVREFMKQVGLEKIPDDFKEPEDILAFEMEIMNWLIDKQLQSKDEKEEQKWLDRQSEFLKGHLLVWGPACARDMEQAENAQFYNGVAVLMQGLFDLEEQLFHGMDSRKIETLEQAQKRHGKRRTFKGPTFDPEAAGILSDKPES